MNTPILELHDVHARYGREEVLRGITLRLAPGAWFCLLGPNGAGKSTLLHCISTRLQPSSGEVRIDGHALSTDAVAAKQALGFAAAPEQLPDLLTGRQCLEVYALAKGAEEIDAAVLALAAQLGFMKFIDKCVDTYSLGTRQKLCVLLALLGEPRLIVLDEAFNGLDPVSALILKRHLRERLQRGRCAVLLATHSLDIVEHYADRAALLLEGRLVHEWQGSEIRSATRAGGNRLEEMIAGAMESTVLAASLDGR
ncbi:MAG TPA: ABC transporter ATP-binding protein [Povalibacter sp.]|nr:ABC transporter ATP-binding protein [Povalibacter sp.]